ncbi:MAG: diguanylate cyclase [Lachnospiraceae bacterium]|nr:diguanylate cyclase [Lachnospiraceae bacterium]
MKYGALSLEQRLKENVKDYSLENLFDLAKVEEYLTNLHKVMGVELLLTQRHGETAVEVGDFSGFVPDVVNEPGRKIRVQGRTVGHLYAKTEAAPDRALAEQLLDNIVDIYANMGNKHYLYRETAIYADELEAVIEKERYRAKRGEHEDALTGTLSKTYFIGRLKEMEEVAPAAVICANINDWKFVHDHFGIEESDRLIKTIAGIVRSEAGSNYLIGRVDGDVFGIVIPMPEDGEAEDYCSRIQRACVEFDDPVLAPSLAVGMVYRSNVEVSFMSCYSDAEYEMFNNKYDIKNAPGYRERLEHGLR